MENFAAKYRTVNERRSFALFSPLPSILRFPSPHLDFTLRPASALFPRVNSADSPLGGEGVAWVTLYWAFPQTKK
jgi:hypothetical protein